MKLRVAKKIARAPICVSCGCCWKHRRGTRARAWRRMMRAGLRLHCWMLPGVIVGRGGSLKPIPDDASWIETFSSQVTWVIDPIPVAAAPKL
jgi:hypothetical protein